MTRETKVGLLVGMGIILLIGIVVSDHLSKVQQQQPADFTQLTSQTFDSLTTTTGNTPGRAIRNAPGSTENTSGYSQSTRINPIPLATELTTPRAIPTQTPNKTAPQPKRIRRVQDMNEEQQLARNTPRPWNASRNITRTKPRPPMATVVDRQTQTFGQPTTTNRILHRVAEGETLADIAKRYYNNSDDWHIIRNANRLKVSPNGWASIGTQLVIPNHKRTRDFRQASTQIQTHTPNTTNNPQTVTVKAGQTLSGIAQKYLGKASAWEEILAANEDQITEPEQLRAGMTLKLPVLKRSKTPARSSSTLAKTTTSMSRQASKPKTYTIQSGDTLSELAHRFMGSASQWQKLYQFNKNVIRDPDNLRVSIQIQIPSS